MRIFKKILVPVDGSRYSLNAARLAAEIAEIHGSDLKLFHVLDVLMADQLKSLLKKNSGSIREELKSQAQGFLRDMVREIGKKNVNLEILIKEGIPHEAIIKEAASWGADLVVLGKLGRRGISHIVLGSVAERVIEFSEMPVLVVK